MQNEKGKIKKITDFNLKLYDFRFKFCTLKNLLCAFRFKFYASSGFTLIEAIVYMGLLTLIIGGAIITTYQLLSGQQSLSKDVLIEEEASFLKSKIEWALSDVETIYLPTPNTSNVKLMVNKNDYSQNPIEIAVVGIDLTIEKNNNGSPIILNSSRFIVSTLSFDYTQTVTPVTTNSIKATFYVNGKKFETTRLISR